MEKLSKYDIFKKIEDGMREQITLASTSDKVIHLSVIVGNNFDIEIGFVVKRFGGYNEYEYSKDEIDEAVSMYNRL